MLACLLCASLPECYVARRGVPVLWLTQQLEQHTTRRLYETAQMPAGRYWDLQLVQNYIYPRATFGEEPLATNLKAAPDELIRYFDEKEVNVIVVGGETNAYWHIMGANYRKSVSVDQWR